MFHLIFQDVAAHCNFKICLKLFLVPCKPFGLCIFMHGTMIIKNKIGQKYELVKKFSILSSIKHVSIFTLSLALDLLSLESLCPVCKDHAVVE